MSGPGPETSPVPEQPVTSPPAAAGGMSKWAEATAPKPIPGTAGLFYADVPNRTIAYIIDVILLGIIGIIVGIFFTAIGLSVTTSAAVDYAAAVVLAVVTTAISAAYFIYSWMNLRGTPGQKLLGMQVGNAADGANLTMDQSIRRWVALGAPVGLLSALNPLPTLGALIGLLALIWFIALLVTTAQSPTKQGLHDQFAETVVVKAARSVG